MELEKVRIRRIIGPTPSGAAILLGNEEKTFVVFVGLPEAAALIREINGETPARPLTHDLIQNVFLGFDVQVKKVIVSSIIENTFCATLVLEQKISDAQGEWIGKRNEVRIDARPSDCLVIALKNNIDIFVTREVFDQVQDISKLTADVDTPGGISMEDLEIEISAKLENMEFKFGDVEFEPEDEDEEPDGDDADDEDDDEEDDDDLEEDGDSEFGGLSFRSGK